MLAAKQSPVSNPEKKLFYHNDHLGGVNVITDMNGVKVQLNEYDPWGKVSRTEGNVDPEKRFTGQILDPESGLYYYGARYYDPELARFISPDPIVPSPGDPQTLNRYSYVRNNPVKYIDPSGMSFWSAIANFFKGFFRSIPALVTGILVGWACVPCHIVVAGILGGIAAAVVNTAINGGNWGQSIGMGAVLGGIIGGIGGDVFKGFGGGANASSWANFVAGVKTGAAFGAVIGGISTAIHGGNVFQNVAMGALSGAVSSAAAFGIMKGATEAWNSMPGARYEEGTKQSVGGRANVAEALDEAERHLAGAPEADKIIGKVKSLYAQGKIVLTNDLPFNIRASFDERTGLLKIDFSLDQAQVAGRIAHEGTHAHYFSEGRDYNFAEERAAFDNGFRVDSGMKLKDAVNPSDAWIMDRYEHRFGPRR